MQERERLIYQRPKNTKVGIWWVNSQKKYLQKIITPPNKEKIPDLYKLFLCFIIKEIVNDKKLLGIYTKDSENFTYDTYEDQNYKNIDVIFNKIVKYEDEFEKNKNTN